MFKTRKKIESIIKDVLKDDPKLVSEFLSESPETLTFFFRSNPKILQEVVFEMLQDTEFLTKLGREFAKAEALRISKERQRQIDDLTIKEQEMEESPEPWVETVSMGYDKEKGIMLRTFWNTAFIKYLKENGITGQTEEEAVERWIGRLNMDIIINDLEI